MKDFTEAQLRNGRPKEASGKVVRFCLHRLFDDREHTLSDLVVAGLTFEELIGALLQAEDDVAPLSYDDSEDES